MPPLPPLSVMIQRFQLRAESWRDQLARVEALPQLTLLGLLTGILSGAVIVLFRWLVEIPLALTLPGNFENFEALGAHTRFWLVFVGATLLGLVLWRLPRQYHATGIAHVLDRLQNNQGRMPAGNVVHQFFGGAACLLTGQSVGREGPAVHLGAGAASLLGQWLRLPNNNLRPLAGCGVAAAIAACFNTPMAGVIFAMEVVMLEYSIAGFIPVTLAAVMGAAITRMAFGPEIAFINAKAVMGNLFELPLMLMVGFVVALFSTAYIRLHTLTCQLTLDWSVAVRFCVAGFTTAVCAIQVPQIMGIGYDTIGAAINGELGIGLLLLIAVVKLTATGVSLGVGMPGGVVGPLLFLGACIGGTLGVVANHLLPESASAIGFYVVLGMGAMMGATLNTPLAAMMATLELTYNPDIIFPSMLVVIAACLTTRWIFKCDGLFESVLKIQGKFRTPELIEQLLRKTGTRQIVDRRVRPCASQLTPTQATELLATKPHWLILDECRQLMPAQDLAVALTKLTAGTQEDFTINLLDIPAQRVDLVEVPSDSTVYEALQILRQAQVGAGYMKSEHARLLGVVTLDKINTYYKL